MDYEIKLPKKVKGTDLLNAIEKASKKLSWMYGKRIKLKQYSLSSGSVQTSVKEYYISIGTFGLILPQSGNIFIKPDETYSEITVYHNNILTTKKLRKENLEKFSSQLYSALN